MTTAGQLLLMSGLTFHSGRRLADHPELLEAIEAAAVAARNAEIAEAVRGLRLAEGGGDPEHEDAVWQYNAGLDAALVIVERT